MLSDLSTEDLEIVNKYQQQTDIEHVLSSPDTYMDSVKLTEDTLWVFDESTQQIALKQIDYIPGLYKLFDEGVVNCRDHIIRMIQDAGTNVTYIKLTVSEDGVFTFENDGNGIDIVKHPTYDLWTPELIIGHLRSGTNYNKSKDEAKEQSIIGGKNGYGIKLAMIWSTYGGVETLDATRGLKYTQEFRDNLSTICAPTVVKVAKSAKPYTKIWCRPDYARFGIDGLSPDMVAMLKKRAYDIGGITDQYAHKIKIYYNNLIVPVKNFQQYIDACIGPKTTVKRVYEQSHERWEYAVALSTTHQFEQVSFVNGICTLKGGKHVEYITGQLTRGLVAYIEKKKKITVNPATIKEQLILFLRCDIMKPSFGSQTKNYLNTASSLFGSKCTVTDAFIEKVAKLGVMETACSLTTIKEARAVSRKKDGVKSANVYGIEKFVDANFAGTAKSRECTLILCEGDSAKSGVVSGLSSEDRDRIGIYPLKGKPLNVRDKDLKKTMDNKEISDIVKILGLEIKKEYRTIDDVHRYLRYSKVMLLCDADPDGSHITSLCVNIFHFEWASLFKISGFLSYMNTPILKATSRGTSLSFYNNGEYNLWKQATADFHKWTVKYYKGLGTSTKDEFKAYFANKKYVDFQYTGQPSDDSIVLAFDKKHANARKTWLLGFDGSVYNNTADTTVTYENYINHTLIHFSVYDCERSIPNVIDGFKTSIRKILYGAFKRNLTTEVKVAQLMGYVSEHSAYHHGEASLAGAIVGLAGCFVGSNNISLLDPCGQFGTRLMGGKDAASPRYIFTRLNCITRLIFPKLDDSVLDYTEVDDDDKPVNPDYYVPIIPFVLVNGDCGIGTAYSCDIPAYNPKQIVQYIIHKLNGMQYDDEFVPYYEGFTGSVVKIEPHRFLVKGKYVVIDDVTVQIVELPVGSWTDTYKLHLEKMAVNEDKLDKDGKKTTVLAAIKNLIPKSTDITVSFTLTFTQTTVAELEASVDKYGVNDLEKLLKLTTTISTTNMMLFNSECKLQKYATVEDIIDAHYEVRYALYIKRKTNQLAQLRSEYIRISNKARFISLNLSGEIDLRHKESEEVTDILSTLNFATIADSYDYMTTMPMDSVTKKKADRLLKEQVETKAEITALSNTSIESMWIHELNVFEAQYDKYKLEREALQNTDNIKAPAKIKVKRAPLAKRP